MTGKYPHVMADANEDSSRHLIVPLTFPLSPEYDLLIWKLEGHHCSV